MRTAACLLVVTCLGAVAGCDWSVFDAIAGAAGVAVLEVESGDKTGYGTALATMDNGDASRVVVSAGAASKFFVFRVWEAGKLELGAPFREGCPTGVCGMGTGTALAGIAEWTDPDGATHALCALTTAPGDGEAAMLCPDLDRQFLLSGVANVGFGTAAVALPPGSDAGVALLSAPGAPGGGALYRYAQGSNTVAEITLPDGILDEGFELGAVLAVGALPTGDVLVAAQAPGAPKVVVFVLNASGIEVRACLHGSAVGYGGALALGDVDDDQVPDLFIGFDRVAPARSQVVEMYSGADLPTDAGCVAWPELPTEIDCPEGAEIECADSGFGSALAVGDVDGDGDGDLVVGAPMATVGGQSEAGALFILPSDGSFPSEAGAVSVSLSTPAAEDRLGTTASTVATHLGISGATPRQEPVAGVPGADAVAVFLCTGLPGDTPDVGARCIPE
jgi:hypothetical protein